MKTKEETHEQFKEDLFNDGIEKGKSLKLTEVREKIEDLDVWICNKVNVTCGKEFVFENTRSLIDRGELLSQIKKIEVGE